MRDFFENEIVISIISVVIVLGISIGIAYLCMKNDEKNCIKNGGKYIYLNGLMAINVIYLVSGGRLYD